MEKFTEVFPLRLSPKMSKQVKAAADREYMTISSYLRKVIRETLVKDRKIK